MTARIDRLGDLARDRELMDRVEELQQAWQHRVDALPDGRPTGRRPAPGALDARGVPRQPLGPAARHRPAGLRRADPQGARLTVGYEVRAAPPRCTASKVVAVERGALTAYAGRVEAQQPVEPHLARTALRVPGAGADVHPLAPVAVLLGGVDVVVARGELQREQLAALLADHEHRPVLALRRVVLVGHPGPDDLAGVRPAVGLRRVAQARGRPGCGSRRRGSRKAIGSPPRVEKLVRRAGSASRRVAARSGLFWDPGLPRPGARPTVQAKAVGSTAFAVVSVTACRRSGQRAGELEVRRALELVGEGEQPRGRHVRGVRRAVGPASSGSSCTRPAAATRANAAARKRVSAKSPTTTPLSTSSTRARTSSGPGGSTTPEITSATGTCARPRSNSAAAVRGSAYTQLRSR